MRVWSLLRPISMGTYPKEYGVREIVNFHCKQFVPEINRQAFGYIDYEQDLPKEVQEHYDLMPGPEIDPELERYAKAFARFANQGDRQRMWKVIEKAFEADVIEEEEELINAASMYV